MALGVRHELGGAGGERPQVVADRVDQRLGRAGLHRATGLPDLGRDELRQLPRLHGRAVHDRDVERLELVEDALALLPTAVHEHQRDIGQAGVDDLEQAGSDLGRQVGEVGHDDGLAGGEERRPAQLGQPTSVEDDRLGAADLDLGRLLARAGQESGDRPVREEPLRPGHQRRPTERGRGTTPLGRCGHGASMPGPSDRFEDSRPRARPPRGRLDSLRPGRVRLGEGVVVVAPLVEALVLHVMRRRAGDVAAPRPTRLVSQPHVVDSVGFVADRTSVLLRRPGADLQVLPAGSLVLPTLLGRGRATCVVVSHDPVDIWLQVGPFETRDDRLVHQIELRLTVALSDSAARLRELADESGDRAAGTAGLEDLGEAVLDRLAREITERTTEAVRRRTLAELTSLSVRVLLDGALPATFLGGLLDRTVLEVADVDWPTEGRGWSFAPAEPGPR